MYKNVEFTPTQGLAKVHVSSKNVQTEKFAHISKRPLHIQCKTKYPKSKQNISGKIISKTATQYSPLQSAAPSEMVVKVTTRHYLLIRF